MITCTWPGSVIASSMWWAVSCGDWLDDQNVRLPSGPSKLAMQPRFSIGIGARRGMTNEPETTLSAAANAPSTSPEPVRCHAPTFEPMASWSVA